MAIELKRGDVVHAVELEEHSDGRVVGRVIARAEDAAATDASASSEHALEVRDLGAGRYLLLEGTRVHDVRVERRGETRFVTIGGTSVELELLDPLRQRGVRGGAGGGGPRAVSAPIPGRIVEVPLGPGDEVAEGQTVVVVEAMKMANELRSPIAGRVAAVKVRPGDTVEAGMALVIVEPS
jgi:biotin carboxyl carrier protein